MVVSYSSVLGNEIAEILSYKDIATNPTANNCNYQTFYVNSSKVTKLQAYQFAN